jgi:hypothetical protein
VAVENGGRRGDDLVQQEPAGTWRDRLGQLRRQALGKNSRWAGWAQPIKTQRPALFQVGWPVKPFSIIQSFFKYSTVRNLRIALAYRSPKISKLCKVKDKFKRNHFPFGNKFKFPI